MPLNERLGSLSKDKEREVTSPSKDVVPPETQQAGYIQRCVIIQRDEKGYGLTVSGDNPVFVQSVKDYGAAARAGVQQGDRIIKVNGTLVTNSNHVEVVKLIKSGSYVALTLLGQPPGQKNPDRITGPQPVDHDKEKEFESQKIATTRMMYEQAINIYETIRKDYLRDPSEKLQIQLAEAQKTLQTIENQLYNLTGVKPTQVCHSPDSLNQFESPQSPQDKLDHSALAFAKIYTPTPWTSGIKHQKSPSMPDSFYSEDGHVPVTRSQSDLGSLAAQVSSPDSPHDTKEKLTTTSLPSTMTESADFTDNSSSPAETSLDSFGHPTLSDGNDNLSLHESGSEPPLKQNEDASKLQMISPHQVDIICMEEDEFASEEEQTIDDHGPFNDLTLLKTKPAHLSVFLHYLISNSDPSPLFFYLVTEPYAQGSLKEMKKWAYEIHSTFLLKDAPLQVTVDDSVISAVNEVLQTKIDKEDVLKIVFQPARNSVQNDVSELLADFRNKRALGLGSFYGDQALQDDNMDRVTELKTVEKCLAPDLETLVNEDTDRSQAMSAALATFLRSLGYTKVGSFNALERCSSFNAKDKQRIFRIKSKKTYYHRGHNFSATHYISTTYCTFCHKTLWGIGNQGYLCSSCDMNTHKHCIENIEEHCGGQVQKNKKDKKDRRSVFDQIKIRKPSSPNPIAIAQAKQMQEDKNNDGLTSPKSAVTTFHIQSPVAEEDETISQMKAGSYVGKLVDRYQEIAREEAKPNQSSSPRGSPEPEESDKRDVSLGRSESLNNNGRRLSVKVNRRTKSDVTVDEETLNSLHNSQDSSSASSLSAKSLDSNSNEQLDNSSQPSFTSRFLADSDLDVEPEMPTLEKQISKDVLKKLKPREKKRLEVINELFFTEKTHLRNLKILESLFCKPMLMDTFVSNDLVRLVFPNLDEMVKLHKSLNDMMKKRQKENPVVSQVGDILMERFDGTAGNKFRNACATFIRNQPFALEMLKTRQRKEQKLSQLLIEAESNPLCRRLQLKDLIPTEFHRLTKYPLLIESLMKYTPPNTNEHYSLKRSLQLSKEILNHVNQAVEDCENQQKLIELNRKLDRKPIENSSNPLVTEYKNLDLTKHKLLYSGDLTWRLSKNKQIEVHVALLEDILVLLQKQDEKLVLKCQSTTVVADTKFTHSPIIKLSTLFLRVNASDKRALFLVSTSALGPQIYDLVGVSSEVRKLWVRNITEAAEASKSGRRNAQVVTAPSAGSNQDPEKPNMDGDMIDPHDTPDVKLAGPFIQPTEVVVSQPTFSESHTDSIEFIKNKDQEIRKGLEEKQNAVAVLMDIKPEEFEHIAEFATEMRGNKDQRELILAALMQVSRLTGLVNDYLQAPLTDKGVMPSVPCDKLSAITANLNDELTQLLDIVTAKDEETLVVDTQDTQKRHSFTSVGSSASEAGDMPVGGSPLDQTALAFGVAATPILNSSEEENGMSNPVPHYGTEQDIKHPSPRTSFDEEQQDDATDGVTLEQHNLTTKSSQDNDDFNQTLKEESNIQDFYSAPTELQGNDVNTELMQRDAQSSNADETVVDTERKQAEKDNVELLHTDSFSSEPGESVSSDFQHSDSMNSEDRDAENIEEIAENQSDTTEEVVEDEKDLVSPENDLVKTGLISCEDTNDDQFDSHLQDTIIDADLTSSENIDDDFEDTENIESELQSTDNMDMDSAKVSSNDELQTDLNEKQTSGTISNNEHYNINMEEVSDVKSESENDTSSDDEIELVNNQKTIDSDNEKLKDSENEKLDEELDTNTNDTEKSESVPDITTQITHDVKTDSDTSEDEFVDVDESN